MSDKVVLDREDVRRTLVRIAHEIVEKTEGQSVAVVGIHRRGAVLAARVRDLVAELVGEPVPLGDIDISFYRDDVAIRVAERPAGGARLAPRLPGRGRHGRARRRRPLHRPHRARRHRGAVRLRPAQAGQLAVLADRGHRELPIRPDYVGKNLPTARAERVNVRVEELDGVDEVAIDPERRQLERAPRPQ